MGTKKIMKKSRGRRPGLKRRDLPLEELKAIVERAKVGALKPEDCEKLDAAVDTLAFLTQELEAKGASIKRLRQMLFGVSTEKTSKVLSDSSGKSGTESDSSSAQSDVDGGDTDSEEKDEADKTKKKKKRKGHGRNGAADYRGAERESVPHQSLQHGDPCPECPKGKVYRQPEPSVLVRVTGMAPLSATVYELERLRCNLCGMVFTARAPDGVAGPKYDESAASMIGLLKYGCGLPFNRLERLQKGLGIPLPASTQWEVVAGAEELLAPAYEELIRQAAQGTVLYNDDTTMKILELMGQTTDEATEDESDERTGMFTSGIVSTCDGHRMALFFTGRRHAGENLEDVLARRAAGLSPPIQMSDALAANTAGDFDTIVANCNAHARRRFVEVADNFPDECRHVLETLREVYKNDAVTREQEMSAEERLSYHQSKSGSLMKELEKWLKAQFEEKKVEPNSGLGDAIKYMSKHWSKLTLFLRVAGAPLDNNICERALKKAILHRKNALFYKTMNGARVGDTFMSLIHTAELCGVDPFAYLMALQRHHSAVLENPGDWMPWNYERALARLVEEQNPPV